MSLLKAAVTIGVVGVGGYLVWRYLNPAANPLPPGTPAGTAPPRYKVGQVITGERDGKVAGQITITSVAYDVSSSIQGGTTGSYTYGVSTTFDNTTKVQEYKLFMVDSSIPASERQAWFAAMSTAANAEYHAYQKSASQASVAAQAEAAANAAITSAQNRQIPAQPTVNEWEKRQAKYAAMTPAEKAAYDIATSGLSNTQ